MMAVKKRQTAVVGILLKAHADLNTQENVILKITLHELRTYTFITLLPQSTGWTALMFAVNECHKAIVQRLVSAGADVLIKDKVCGVMECVKPVCVSYSTSFVVLIL